MKTLSGFQALPLAALIAGCNGGSGPSVRVDDLDTGAYVVSTGDASAPVVGKYYAAADGSRLLVLGDSSDKAQALYRRSAGGDWVAVPEPGDDVRLSLLQSHVLPPQPVSLAAIAGGYVTQLADGSVARFTLGADGAIVAGPSGCKLSGTLAAGTLPNTLQLRLSASACASVPAASNGVLVLDSDYTPARFRLISDDGVSTSDLWAYAE